VGAEAILVESIDDIEEKNGDSGPLIFITIGCSIQQNGVEVLTEKRKLVYLDPRGRSIPLPVPRSATALETGEAAADWCPQAHELFRYSALTYNGHRIHYDADYARNIEGYPAVVVHGPLTATRLALLSNRITGKPVRQLSIRGRAPLFVGQIVHLIGCAEAPGRVQLRALRCDGVTAMEAIAHTA